MTTIVAGLTVLTLPLMIFVFLWQERLNLSSTEHIVAQVLIVCGTYWLILQIIRLDEWLQRRNRMEDSRRRLSEERLAMLERPGVAPYGSTIRSNGSRQIGMPDLPGAPRPGNGKSHSSQNDLGFKIVTSRK